MPVDPSVLMHVWPRRGETYPDGPGPGAGTITHTGALLPESNYLIEALMSGDLFTYDPDSGRIVLLASTGASTTSCSLLQKQAISSVSAGAAITSANLLQSQKLSGSSAGVATTTATLGRKIQLSGTSNGSATTACVLGIAAQVPLSGKSAGTSTTSMFAVLGNPTVLVSLQTLNAANLIEPGLEANLGFLVENQLTTSKTVSISYNLTTIDGTVTGYSASITVPAKSAALSSISLSGALFGHRWVDFSATWPGGSQGTQTKAFHYGHAAGQIADTIGFSWGMNMGFSAEPLDYVRVQILGCDHMRTNYEWSGIEGPQNNFNYSVPDEIIRMNEAVNLKTMWLFVYNSSYGGAQFAVPNTSNYTNFITKMLQRYGLRITWAEIWNEPDNTNFWSGTAAQYLTLLQASYAAVKAVNSSIQVISGGNAGYNAGGTGLPSGLYISNMESTIIANSSYFDYYGYHPHGDLTVMEADINQIASNLGAMSPVRPGFFNETGRSTTGETAFLRENQAIESIKKLAVTRGAYQTPGYTAYELYDSGTDPSDDEQHWGYMTVDRQPKPSFGMTCEFIRLTKNLPFYAVIGSLNANGRFYIFGSVALGFVSIFWNQTGTAIPNRTLNVNVGAKILDYQANVTATAAGTTQVIVWTRNPQYVISTVAPT